MARAKGFDPAQALSAAVQAFWNSGYEKTSLDDLMAQMNIGRQSLYDTFGDKRSLYLLALDEYRRMTQAQAKQLFESRPNVRDCFKEIFFDIVRSSKADLERGCMMINANLERSRTDTAVAKIIKQNAIEVRAMFSTVLRSGQAAGDIPRRLNADDLATFLFSTIGGMRHLGRATGDRVTLEQTANVALSTLG